MHLWQMNLNLPLLDHLKKTCQYLLLSMHQRHHSKPKASKSRCWGLQVGHKHWQSPSKEPATQRNTTCKIQIQAPIYMQQRNQTKSIRSLKLTGPERSVKILKTCWRIIIRTANLCLIIRSQFWWVKRLRQRSQALWWITYRLHLTAPRVLKGAICGALSPTRW